MLALVTSFRCIYEKGDSNDVGETLDTSKQVVQLKPDNQQ